MSFSAATVVSFAITVVMVTAAAAAVSDSPVSAAHVVISLLLGALSIFRRAKVEAEL